MEANEIINRLETAIKKIHAEANRSLKVLDEKAEKNYTHVHNMYDCDESYYREIARYAWAARAKKICMYEMQGVLNDIKKELEIK